MHFDVHLKEEIYEFITYYFESLHQRSIKVLVKT